MKILYAYTGPRDPDFEAAIREDLARRFAEPKQMDAAAGQDGMTTVMLELPGDAADGAEVVAALQAQPRVVEAAEESFGEGV